MTNINKFSTNPQSIDFSEQERYIESVKKIISWETKNEITKEEFEQMSFDDLQKHIKILDWKITIFWNDLNYWLTNVYWSNEKNEKLNLFLENKNLIEWIKNQFQQKELLINILQIWIPEAQKQANVWFKSNPFRNDYKIILENITNIDNAINDFWVPVSEDIFNEQVLKIFKFMNISERKEMIIWEDNLNSIKKIFLDKTISLEQKQISIFNLMRYRWLSWNSEWVKSVIADKLLNTPQFKGLLTNLENPRIKELIEDKEINELEKLFWKELSQELIKIYKKTKQSITIKLDRELKKLNSQRQKEWKESIKFKDYYNEKKDAIDSAKFKSTLDVFRNICIDKKIELMLDRGKQEDSLIWIYANMSGFWKTESEDIFTIADENIDLAIDFATTLAIGAITMWTWSMFVVWTRTLLTWARVANIWSKVAKWLQISEYIEKWTKARAVTSFIWRSTYEWISFYEWATIAQNIMFNDFKDLWNWLWDKEEFVKNIAFMWALNSLHHLSKIPWMKKIMNFNMKIPDEYLKPWNMKKILEWTWTFSVNTIRDWSIMFGISQWIDISLLFNDWKLDQWHPTVKEYIEFIALIQVMHLKDIWKNRIK